MRLNKFPRPSTSRYAAGSSRQQHRYRWLRRRLHDCRHWLYQRRRGCLCTASWAPAPAVPAQLLCNGCKKVQQEGKLAGQRDGGGGGHVQEEGVQRPAAPLTSLLAVQQAEVVCPVAHKPAGIQGWPHGIVALEPLCTRKEVRGGAGGRW